MTKGMVAMLVCTTKECNYNSVVIVHQHGGYDYGKPIVAIFNVTYSFNPILIFIQFNPCIHSIQSLKSSVQSNP